MKDFLEKASKIRTDNYIKLLKEHNLFEEINDYTQEDIKIKEKTYCWFYKIHPQLCICGNKLTFISFTKGYRKFCSPICSSSSKYVQEKARQTCLKKYGVERPESLDIIQEKARQTNMERYGVEHHMLTSKSKDKIRETNSKKYGVEHVFQSEEFREKAKQTNLEKYGVEHPLKSNEIKDKIRKRNIEKYGVEHVFQSEEFREKAKQTNLEKYGHLYPQSSNAIKEKTKLTNIEKYGTDNPAKAQIIKEKTKLTNIEKYGFETPLLNNEIRFKGQKQKNINSLDHFIKILASNFYSIEETEYTNVIENKEYKISCLICNESFITSGMNIQRIHCSNKGCRASSSLGEKLLVDWLKHLGLNIIENDRTLLEGKELDIYLPDYNIAIEYDGLYYHSEANKFRVKSPNYHRDKMIKCQEKDIQLIHIFENEWMYKQDIVKSIIKAKLGLFDERIFARKCIVKELSRKEYDEFLDFNHLQGACVSKTRLGLLYNDEIVSVMGFGKSRFKKDEIELIRFANKLNTLVVGGFSKLLRYFEICYKPENLVSYCDLRYFDGSGYLKNGFEIISRSKPNYFYWKINTNMLQSRMGFQKHKLKDKLDVYDENLSEHENMLNNKYYRIYDCGNLKLIKKFI